MKTGKLLVVVIVIGLIAAGVWYFWPEKAPEAAKVPPNASAHWADSVLATLSPAQKAAQLFIYTPDTAVMPGPQGPVARLIRDVQPGGILLPPEAPAASAAHHVDYHGAAMIPLWAATRTHELLAAHPDFPGMTMLRSLSADSLAIRLGIAAGGLGRQMGLQLNFHPAQPEFSHPNLLGLLEGMRVVGVTSAFAPDYDAIAQQLAVDSLPSRDSLQLARIQSLSENYLLWTLKPAGEMAQQGWKRPLVFAWAKRDTNGAPLQRRAALDLLNSGVDVIMTDAGIRAGVNEIVEAVKKKKVTAGWLDHKARRVLLAKAEGGIHHGFWPDPEGAAAARTDAVTEVVCRQVTEGSLTLLKNDRGKLPLKWIGGKRIATLSIGVRRHSPFQKMSDRYAEMDHYILPAFPSQATLNGRLGVLSRYHTVVVGLHELPVKGDSLFASMRAFLNALDGKTRLVVVHFGEMEKLKGLEELSALVQVHSGGVIAQELAAEMVFGGARALGHLPGDASAMFCEGDGIEVRGTTRLRYTLPEEAGIVGTQLAKIDSVVYEAMRLGVFPGCQVLVAKDGMVVFNKSYGYHTYDRRRPVRQSDLYDLASLTKMLSTTMGIMTAYEEDSIELTTTLEDIFPEVMDSANIKHVTLESMLIHKSGLPSAIPIYYYMTVADSADSIRSRYFSRRPDTAFNVQVADSMYFRADHLDSLAEKIAHSKLYNWGRYVYSDLGFLLLGKSVAEIYGKRQDSVLTDMLYRPLGMRNTCYLPRRFYNLDRIVPTESDFFFRDQLVHGYVHDPAAALFGGVAGHAGLFSSAQDLVILMQMLLNGGTYGGRRYFSPHTVDLFTRRHVNCHRGLGFDKPPTNQESYSMCCRSVSEECFGHTGFTGTCVWADPRYNVTYIFLSNRVHPKSSNNGINIYQVRQGIQQVVYDAMGVPPPEEVCELVPADSVFEGADSNYKGLPVGDSVAFDPVILP